jgi:hypothetical protein
MDAEGSPETARSSCVRVSGLALATHGNSSRSERWSDASQFAKLFLCFLLKGLVDKEIQLSRSRISFDFLIPCIPIPFRESMDQFHVFAMWKGFYF